MFSLTRFPNLKKTKKADAFECIYIIFPYLCPVIIITEIVEIEHDKKSRKSPLDFHSTGYIGMRYYFLLDSKRLDWLYAPCGRFGKSQL